MSFEVRFHDLADVGVQVVEKVFCEARSAVLAVDDAYSKGPGFVAHQIFFRGPPCLRYDLLHPGRVCAKGKRRLSQMRAMGVMQPKYGAMYRRA